MRVERAAAGSALPIVELAPITREILREYAHASGDHAPIHLDSDIARANGFPDVIAHGLLVMGYLGRALGQWFPDHQLKDFSCRFMAITLLGDALHCSGQITAVEGQRVDLDLEVSNQHGELKLKGGARLG